MLDRTTRFGLNGATGEYLSIADSAYLADLAVHETPRREHLADMRARLLAAGPHLGVVDAVEDVTDLSQTGWGIIFATSVGPEIRRALKDLLDFRRDLATQRSPSLYQEYEFYPGETKQSFLRDRHVASSYGADPEQMPYYLLLVGDPESIPYTFQYQLDVQYAVGRIHFDSPDEYACYARGVIAAEARSPRQRQVAFFGPRHTDDRPTELSSTRLIAPLAQRAIERNAVRDSTSRWQVTAVGADESSKNVLLDLLGSRQGPALVFTAGHGLALPPGHLRQREHQGGLVCREWPGPTWRGEVPTDFFVSGDDITDSMQLTGLMAFHFACYSAGTPLLDDYPQLGWQASSPASAIGSRLARPIAAQSFIARLPQRLLGHRHGGALAVVGHVERALSASFVQVAQNGGPRAPVVFDDVLARLMRGMPLGAAMEAFNQRYAELASELSEMVRDVEQNGMDPDIPELARLWTASADARGYVILGDPAVRLATPHFPGRMTELTPAAVSTDGP